MSEAEDELEAYLSRLSAAWGAPSLDALFGG